MTGLQPTFARSALTSRRTAAAAVASAEVWPLPWLWSPAFRSAPGAVPRSCACSSVFSGAAGDSVFSGAVLNARYGLQILPTELYDHPSPAAFVRRLALVRHLLRSPIWFGGILGVVFAALFQALA
ncbi:acyl carrier protein, partial [Streptomyces sp. NPDC057062]|uniref:acyl carrier protein n=1 Tax=Streptomyces sp. NPDC057062 TaxID=3346011 RepID=UPI0036321D24